MSKTDEPRISHVEHVDNAVSVEFDDLPESTIYPAVLLYAARGVADAIIEKQVNNTLLDSRSDKP